MAGENAHNENDTLGNGNIVSAEPTATQKAAAATESIITTIALTIYDVIVFLAISIGYIFQVSSQPNHVYGMFAQQQPKKTEHDIKTKFTLIDVIAIILLWFESKTKWFTSKERLIEKKHNHVGS